MDARTLIESRYPRVASLFAGLSARKRDELFAHLEIREFTKGQAVFRQGQLADSIWMVLDGWVHLVRKPEGANGNGHDHSVVLFTVTPAEMFCGVSALEAETYTASGISGAQTRLLRVPGPVFQRLVVQEPGLAFQVLRVLGHRLQHMAEQYGTMADPVASRIVRMLLRLRAQFGDRLPVTHRELAQMAWTTTESAIRAVRRLKRDGCVTGSRGMLVIERAERLERLLSSARPENGGLLLSEDI